MSMLQPVVAQAEASFPSPSFPSDVELPCTVRIARSVEDIEKVMAIRGRGFAKFLGPGIQPSDAYDSQQNCYLLLAEDRQGNPVGTLRILHRPAAPVETEAYVDLSSDPALDACLEGTRFTVPFYADAQITKFALWKAGVMLGFALQVPTILAPVRVSAKRDYDALLFKDTGLRFFHPRDAKKREHFIMSLDLVTMESRYRACQHKLHDFFFVKRNPGIRLLG